MRGSVAANPSRSRSSPWYQPKNRWLSVPFNCGTCGATPLWAMTARVSSAVSNARFTHRSRMVLFQVGTCSFTMCRTMPAPNTFLRLSATGNGSLCAHHTATEG